MKITLNNNIRYRKNKGVSAHPREFALKNNKTNFMGSPIETFQKTVTKGKFVEYTNKEKLVETIDHAIGGKYFSTILANSGANLENGKISLDDASFLKDAWRTLKYPILDFPRDIANSAIKYLKKIPALSGAMEKVQGVSILANRAKAVEAEKNADIVRDILDVFVGAQQKGDKETYNIKKCAEGFQKKVASNITETFKNYSSRDERTLNRAATATVSALYGASDFYNISMLQKDDKGEAKKAGKARFKQEMTRMALNAGMVFFSLGAMDKYIKHSTPLTVATIVGSSFISEVASRLLNKVSLKPLTPDEAAKIAKNKAQKQEVKNTEVQQDKVKEPHKQDISFKNNLAENQIYASFARKDKTLPAMNEMLAHAEIEVPSNNKTQAKIEKDKKFGFKEGLGLSFIGASAIYLASYFLKGNYSEAVSKNKFVKQYANQLNNVIKGDLDGVSQDVIDTLKKGRVTEPNKLVSKIIPSIKNVLGIPRKLLNKITTSKQEVKVQDLTSWIDRAMSTEAGKEIAPILNEYKKMLEGKGETVTLDIERKLLAVPLNGLTNGVKKLFNVVWRVLSTPGMIVKSVIEAKTAKNANTIFNEASKGFKTKSSKKQIEALYNIFKKQDMQSPEGVKKAIEKIIDKTRHFNSGSETSEIANYSRALVTMIGSYFFVNDYYNKVLIESGGKNTREANEERNERIAHKLSNFIINGTLMNVFNTTFNKQLNNSLVQATLIATATELTNEAMVRKSICQPIGPKNSRQEIIDWEQKQTSKKGIMGAWSRFFRKITGKKVLTEKAGIDVQKENKDKTQTA